MVKHTFEVEVTIDAHGNAHFGVLDADVPLDRMVDCVAAYCALIQRLDASSPLALKRN